MANNFYQLKDSPEVFTGTTDEAGKIIKGDAFGTEESFIKAGGIRGTDKYWENVSTITPESLSPTKAYDLKDMPQNAINDADVSVVGAEEQAKINTQAKAKEEETAESDILKTLTQLESEGTEQAAAEEAAGIPGFQKEQADVTGQIAVKTAEYNQLKAQEEALKTQFEGMAGITLSEVSGRKGVIERQFLARKNAAASDIALLQAQSLAISGKQIAAQGAVDRAIDLKYDSKRQKLDTQKFLYDVIRGDLTKAEEEQLRIQEEATAREEAVLEETKNIEKAEKATLLSQMNQYPDAGIQLTDSLEVANQKITQNSQIYRQQTRLANQPTPTPTPTPTTDYRNTLYNVGLPVNIATTSGQLTKGNLDKLVNAGLPSETAQGIYDAIIQGYTLDEVRQYLRDNGVDPVILDTFMQTLQGIDEGDKLDDLINQYIS